MIGKYKVYNDANKVKKCNENLIKLLAGCKDTLKETIQLEDYEEEGIINVNALKESFETLGIDIDDDLMDYIIFVLYQRSESLDKLKYEVLFDLLDGKIV